MSDGKISQVQLPNGDVYDIEDQTKELSSTYDSNTKTVTLVIADNTVQ